MKKESENRKKKVNSDSFESIEQLYSKVKIGSFSDYRWLLENYKNFKSIERSEEMKIISDAKNGRTEAKIILISLVFPYIIKMYRLLYSNRSDYFEHLSEGIQAALEAINRYDLRKYSVKFSTYAVYWIYHSLVKSSNSSSNIKIPFSIYSEYSKFVKAYDSYVHKYSKKPSLSELIEFIYGDKIKQSIKADNPDLSESDDLFKKKYNEQMSLLRDKYSRLSHFISFRSDVSLQDFKFSDSSKTVEDFLAYDPGIDDDISKKNFKIELVRIINSEMEDEDKLILTYYFGLLDNEPRSIESLRDLIHNAYGKRYSKERVRQKLRAALNRLGKLLKKRNIDIDLS